MIPHAFNFPVARAAWSTYVLAVVAVGLGLAGREALTLAMGRPAVPFIFFFPAIVVTAWYGGLRPGMLALVLSVLCADWFYLEPYFSLRVREPVPLLAFVVASALMLAVIEESHGVKRRLIREMKRRESAEADSARTRDLLATTLTSVGDGLMAADSSGRVTFLNREAERLTGWTAEEASGHPLSEVFRVLDGHTSSPAQDLFQEVRRTGATVTLGPDALIVARDGRETPIGDSAAPIRSPSGACEGVVVVFRDVTEERRAQEARARLAAIVEFSGDAIVTKNLDGVIQTWNASAEKLFGYRAEEIIGKPVTVLFPPERLDEEDHILGLLRQGQPCKRFETVRVAKNGKKIPVFVSVSPVKDPSGRVTGASKVIHDITDLVAARTALAEERELLRTTLASIGDGVIVTDPDGRITFLNREAERLTGWKLERAAGKPLPAVFRVVHEETRETVENPVEKVIRCNGVVGLANHTVLIAKDGTETSIDDSAAPIRRPGGPLAGVVLVFRDFTERKHAEEESRRLTTLVQAVNEARGLPEIYDAALLAVMQCLDIDRCSMMLTDADRVTRFKASRGLSDEFLRLSESLLSVKPNEAEPVWFRRTTEIDAGLRKSLEQEGIGGLGLVPITYESRVLGGLMLCYTEPHQLTERELRVLKTITSQVGFAVQRRRAEEQLEQLVRDRTAKLREMVAELEHVSYAITHDMRAPLRAMSAFAGIVLEEISILNPARPELEDYCRRVMVAAGRLDKLIQESLRYTKTVLQQTPVQPVDLSELLPSLIKTYPNLQPGNAEITIQTPLPMVLGDEGLLTQCFSNLLGNAVKFVAPGVHPRVRIWAQTAEGVTRITVEDNGIGISARAQKRLFCMFQRLTSEYEGTGIGLAIVRKVVERMGGKVGAESELGKGSRFWVELRTAEPRLAGNTTEVTRRSDGSLPIHGDEGRASSGAPPMDQSRMRSGNGESKPSKLAA